MPTQAKTKDGLTMQRPARGAEYQVKDESGAHVATITPPGIGTNSVGKEFMVKLHNVEGDVESFFKKLSHAFDHVVTVLKGDVKADESAVESEVTGHDEQAG